jgi:hypothetical protein
LQRIQHANCRLFRECAPNQPGPRGREAQAPARIWHPTATAHMNHDTFL